MPEPVPDVEPGLELWNVGERIENLLDASSAHGAVNRERAEELVRLVTDLYGAGLERLLEIVHDRGGLTSSVLADLAADELVGSLLLVHGLHPYDLPTRVERALVDLGPVLAQQHARVGAAEVTDDGTVTVTLGGEVGGCGSAALVELVETAVRAAAPDAADVRVEVGARSGPAVIPVSALRSRLSGVRP